MRNNLLDDFDEEECYYNQAGLDFQEDRYNQVGLDFEKECYYEAGLEVWQFGLEVGQFEQLVPLILRRQPVPHLEGIDCPSATAKLCLIDCPSATAKLCLSLR